MSDALERIVREAVTTGNYWERRTARRAALAAVRRCVDIHAETMSWEEAVHEILREFPEAKQRKGDNHD